LEGCAVPLEDVRAALHRRLRSLLEGVDRELRAHARRHGLDPETEAGRREALETMAGVLASRRGSAAIPRRGRVKAADRARGLLLLMSTFGLQSRALVNRTPTRWSECLASLRTAAVPVLPARSHG
jgi:hypothetical protein